jgi:hypothetical protein
MLMLESFDYYKWKELNEAVKIWPIFVYVGGPRTSIPREPSR